MSLQCFLNDLPADANVLTLRVRDGDSCVIYTGLNEEHKCECVAYRPSTREFLGLLVDGTSRVFNPSEVS
jgi:hypothetical protein